MRQKNTKISRTKKNGLSNSTNKKITLVAIKAATPQTSAAGDGLKKRIISGLVMAALFLIFFLLPRNWQLIAVLLVVFFTHHEWQRLARQTPRPFTWFAVGFFYVLLAAVSAVFLLNLYALWFFITLLLVMACDIGSYATGKLLGARLLGGKKLAPNLSPGKTWVGVIGGVCLSALLMLVFILSGVLTATSAMQYVILLIASITIAGFSILGDLFESLLKRQARVKDSGVIIPGHGGVLDRVDGYLLALPLTALLIIAKIISF